MKRVLIVDDSSEIRTLVRLAFSNRYRVQEASDAFSALAFARAEKPDVILLDIVLPGGLSGLGFLKLLQLDPVLQDCPVIMITGLSQTAEFEEAMANGAIAYFIKPFSPADLLDCVDQLLGTGDERGRDCDHQSIRF